MSAKKVIRPKYWPKKSKEDCGIGKVLDQRTSIDCLGGHEFELVELLVLWENGVKGWEIIGHGTEWYPCKGW